VLCKLDPKQIVSTSTHRRQTSELGCLRKRMQSETTRWSDENSDMKNLRSHSSGAFYEDSNHRANSSISNHVGSLGRGRGLSCRSNRSTTELKIEISSHQNRGVATETLSPISSESTRVARILNRKHEPQLALSPMCNN
jgi:hypothetical protein